MTYTNDGHDDYLRGVVMMMTAMKLMMKLQCHQDIVIQTERMLRIRGEGGRVGC